MIADSRLNIDNNESNPRSSILNLRYSIFVSETAAMQRNRILLLSVAPFLVGFLLCGGTGLLINKLMHGSDTGLQAKLTTPAPTVPTAPRPTAPRPTEPAKTTVTKTVPKATVPVPTAVFVPKKGEIPPDAELHKLVITTLLDLDGAIKTKDYTTFHSKMSALWQSDDGKRSAQSFGKGLGINLGQVKDGTPVFKPAPVLGADGVLMFTGHVVKTHRVDFQFGYVFEQGAWKLQVFGNIGWAELGSKPME